MVVTHMSQGRHVLFNYDIIFNWSYSCIDSCLSILDRLERNGMDSNSDKKENQAKSQNMFGASADIERGRSRTMLHCYNGGLHILSQECKLPDMTFAQFITLWLCGRRAKGVLSLGILQTTHLKHHIPHTKHALCAMRYLMKAVERQTIKVGK